MKKLLTVAAVLLSLDCFSQKVSGDTLIVNSDKIKWVMIGGELYEVKRSVTLEKVVPSGIKTYFDTDTMLPRWRITQSLLHPIGIINN